MMTIVTHVHLKEGAGRDWDAAMRTRLAKEWRAKREPALAALGEVKTGAEKAWGELTALDSAITKFREPSQIRPIQGRQR